MASTTKTPPARATAKAPARRAADAKAPAAKRAAGAKTAAAKKAPGAAPAPAARPSEPAKAVKAVKAAKIPKAREAKKPADGGAAPKAPKQKLVRDSFTIPRSEYATLDALKQRLVALARPAKKSEVLRAGIKLLSTLDDAALLDVMAAVPAIKTGRPKADK